MPTFRIDLAYDGAGFHGYAGQQGLRTVQGELERALATVVGDVETEVAGRTDAGVHASAQVVSFTHPDILDVERLARSLNRMLNPEVAVAAVTVTAEGFSARHDATSRRYRYTVDNGPVPDPLARRFSWWMAGPLDIGAMNAAAAAFLGEHDFASLCRAAAGKSTVRRVLAASWSRRGAFLDYEVEAGAFCHQMVRSMVALCVDVGRGRVAAGDVPAILAARDRSSARGAAPAQGLTLIGVRYDP